ncbi:AbfB domain-containing protein [Actinoplanes sp. CA-142083]|uniref:AbfB domain-containing protein n=1 Tax=Actinoplanes sp. CA-142083 TaxID=3239903 RepID=UPI003D91630F
MPHADTDTFAARVARFLGAVRAHPVAVAVSAVALALGVAAIVAGWTVSAPSQAANGLPPPLPRRGEQIASGPLSLEAADSQGRFVAVDGDAGALAEVSAGSPAAARRAATFVAEPGLAATDCFSFRAADGRYLRDASGRLEAGVAEPSAAFRQAATFCLRGGFARGSATLEALGQRGKLVRHVGNEMRVEQGDARGTSFLVRAPLG